MQIILTGGSGNGGGGGAGKGREGERNKRTGEWRETGGGGGCKEERGFSRR